MNRDDRLFAVIGGSVVAAVTTIFLVSAGGITGRVKEPERVRVTPIPAPQASEKTRGVVHANYEESTPVVDDALVRTVTSQISAHPQWLAWMVTDGLIDRFVAAVEAVADGYSPRDQLDFLTPWRPFIVREDQDQFVIAAGTYSRFDLAAEVFASIDADATVALYRQLEPMIHEARRDVAWHRGDFEDRMRSAIDHLLEVEIPDGQIEVERRTLSYVFADDELERLSGAQRQMLRMGAANAARVQTKLRDIRAAFDWPEPTPETEGQHALDDGGDQPDTIGETLIAEVLPEQENDPETETTEPLRVADAQPFTPLEEAGSNPPAPMLIDLDRVMSPLVDTTP